MWFMDDGSYTGSGATINTHCFSMEEQERVVKMLLDKFDIPATIVKDRTKYKIAISRRGYEKLVDMIAPFIVPTMTYKIANPRNDLAHAR